MPQVMLVDGELVVRKALKGLLENGLGYEVVAEASDADELLALQQSKTADLLLTEIALTGRSGIELALELSRVGNKIPIVVLTRIEDPDSVRRAFAAGILGYVLKRGDDQELANAIKSALSGSRYLTPLLPQQSDIALGEPFAANKSSADPLSRLSPREREIFHLLANGLQNAAIARKLFISPRTVETHRARVVRKLGLQSNAELIRFSIRHGLSVL